MMNFDEFCEFIEKHIAEHIPSGHENYHIEIKDITKNNGRKLRGISLRKENSSIAPILYAQDAYQRYMQGEKPDEILKNMINAMLDVKPVYQIEDMLDFEKIKDKIGFKLLNYNLNKERLQDNAWKAVRDLAKVYGVFLMGNEGMYTASIPNGLLKEWKIDIEELDKIATCNMERMMPPTLIDMMDAIQNGNILNPPNLLKEEKLHNKNELYVLSNAKNCSGAAVILYPGVLEKISEMAESDLYIIPSSVDEVLIFPKNNFFSARELGKIVREANRMMPKEAILSDRVYEFTYAESKIHELVDSRPPRRKEKVREC